MRLVDADAIENQAYDDVHHHAELEDWEFDVVVNYLDRAPTIDAVPVVHGKWVISSDGYYPYCSACLKTPESGVMTKHCPECGARMDGGAADGI